MSQAHCAAASSHTAVLDVSYEVLLLTCCVFSTKFNAQRSVLHAGITGEQASELGVNQLVQVDGTEPTSFQYLPTGVRGLFEAALDAEGLTESTLFNTPVLRVANDGLVTSEQGVQQYDAVIVTVRPEAALAMLDPPLKQV